MDMLTDEPEEKTNTGRHWRKPKFLDNEWVSVVLFIMGVALVYFIIQAFLFRSYQVDGQSMENTLQNDDRLIIDKIPRTIARITQHAYIPHRGDIVVFNQSGINDSPAEKQLIKRVIGLPGERIVVRDGLATVYNAANPGGFNPDGIGLYHIDATNTAGQMDITLGPSQLFVMGDNRNNSEDSRIFGPIQANKVVGKLTLRVLPLNKAQRF